MATRHALFMVHEGHLVRPNGRRSWARLTKTTEDAVKQIAAASSPETPAYIYDVDGVDAGLPQFTFYQKLEQAHAMPWIHSGCRTADDAMDTFFAGAEAITVELRHMGEEHLGDLSDIAEGEIHLAVEVGRDARPPRLDRLVEEHGLAGIVLTSPAEPDAWALESVAKDLRARRVPTTLLSTTPFALPPGLEGSLDRVIEAKQVTRDVW